MVVIMNIPFAHYKFDSKSTLYTFSGIFVTYFTYGGYKSGRLMQRQRKGPINYRGGSRGGAPGAPPPPPPPLKLEKI
jgi:hypothetical protein